MLVGVDDKPGVVAKIFGALAEKNISVDMIIQNTSTGEPAGPAPTSRSPSPRPTSRAPSRSSKSVARRVGAQERPLRRGHRQGVDRRPRHALARRHRRADVPASWRDEGDQHPGDLDERDQGLAASSRRSTRSSRCARCTTASGSTRQRSFRIHPTFDLRARRERRGGVDSLGRPEARSAAHRAAACLRAPFVSTLFIASRLAASALRIGGRMARVRKWRPLCPGRPSESTPPTGY